MRRRAPHVAQAAGVLQCKCSRRIPAGLLSGSALTINIENLRVSNEVQSELSGTGTEAGPGAPRGLTHVRLGA